MERVVHEPHTDAFRSTKIVPIQAYELCRQLMGALSLNDAFGNPWFSNVSIQFHDLFWFSQSLWCQIAIT